MKSSVKSAETGLYRSGWQRKAEFLDYMDEEVVRIMWLQKFVKARAEEQKRLEITSCGVRGEHRATCLRVTSSDGLPLQSLSSGTREGTRSDISRDPWTTDGVSHPGGRS
jgi:hypothetical protein